MSCFDDFRLIGKSQPGWKYTPDPDKSQKEIWDNMRWTDHYILQEMGSRDTPFALVLKETRSEGSIGQLTKVEEEDPFQEGWVRDTARQLEQLVDNLSRDEDMTTLQLAMEEASLARPSDTMPTSIWDLGG